MKEDNQKSPGENHKEGEEKDGEERDQEKTKIVTHFSPPDGSFNGVVFLSLPSPKDKKRREGKEDPLKKGSGGRWPLTNHNFGFLTVDAHLERQRAVNPKS